MLDGRGNVVALADATGTLVNHYYYAAWGLPISPDNGPTRPAIEPPDTVP